MTMWQPDLTGRQGPLYRRIVEALAEAVEAGTLPAGTRLPTHRDLAAGLGVTIGTVTRAYAEAERRGLVVGRVGSGTYVGTAEPAAGLPGTPEPVPGLLDLSFNGAADVHAGEVAAALSALAARQDLAALLGYQADVGRPAHRAAGAAWLARSGANARPEQVLVTNGGQHALAVALATVARPGDLVLAEAVTYAGLKALASLLDLRLEGVALDRDGLVPEAVEEACRRGPVRALYVIPTLQNPTTALMPEARRRRLAEICRRHDVVLIEDHVDGFLVADAPPPLVAFAPERTFLLTSLSKSLAPGLRIGYMLAPEAYVARAAAVLRTLSWMAAPLMAEVAALLVQDGAAARIVEAHRREARARQRIAARVLAGASVETRPEAYHLWLHLPPPWRAADFAARSREAGVAVAPAEVFAVDRARAPEAVRVALGVAPDRAALEGGLRVLARLLAAPPAPYLPVL